MTPLPPRILLVATDAGLRQEAFDRLAEAGYAVDGVGDAGSAEKRLRKDVYVLIVVEEGALGELDAGDTSVLILPRTEEPTLLDLEERVRRALGDETS